MSDYSTSPARVIGEGTSGSALPNGRETRCQADGEEVLSEEEGEIELLKSASGAGTRPIAMLE